ncbi:hypothetical protein CsSME_00019858 [Camellia sinensis var. sinensis]
MDNGNLPRRVIKETQRLLSEPAPGISASPSEDNMRYFNVMILGPTQSPYEDITDDLSFIANDGTPSDDVTPRTMLGPENIPARKALKFDPVAQTSPSTSMQETMQTIMDQAKQNEQRLEDMVADNERLRKELALELAKSQQIAPRYD